MPFSAPFEAASTREMSASPALNTLKLRVRLKRLGVSQARFAEILRLAPSTVEKWIASDAGMHPAAQLVLHLAEQSSQARRLLCLIKKPKCGQRGRPFKRGNPYRFGDRRRKPTLAKPQTNTQRRALENV